MNNMLNGVLIGLLVAVSVVYFVETYDELIQEMDMIKGLFFLATAVGYAGMTIIITRKSAGNYLIFTIAGSIVLIILYAITRTDMAAVFLMEPGSIGHLGITSKIIQICIIVVSVMLYKKQIHQE